MKKLITFLVFAVLAGVSAFGQGTEPLTIICPSSSTSTFKNTQGSDIPCGFAPMATTCQRIVLISNADVSGGAQGEYTFSTSFASGNPAPTFLPTSMTGNSGQEFAFGPGQTIVTVMVSTEAGEQKSCSFTVDLIDDEAPSFAEGTPVIFVGKTAATMPDLRNQVLVDEDCDYTITQLPAPGSPISGTSVSLTFIATDAYANASEPYEATLILPGTGPSPLDGVQLIATGGCATDGKITVSVSGLPEPDATNELLILYRINGGPIQSESILLTSPTATFQTCGGLAEGTHTISLIGFSQEPRVVLLADQSILAYISSKSPSISGLITLNPGNNGLCSTIIQGQATGNSFVFTGPNGYVFSNVFRNAGTFTVFANTLKEPGQYTLTVTLPANDCATASTVTQTINVEGTKCQ